MPEAKGVSFKALFKRGLDWNTIYIRTGENKIEQNQMKIP